jgi:hypothetical protein
MDLGGGANERSRGMRRGWRMSRQVVGFWEEEHGDAAATELGAGQPGDTHSWEMIASPILPAQFTRLVDPLPTPM